LNEQIIEGGAPSNAEITQMTKVKWFTLSGTPFNGNKESTFESCCIMEGSYLE